MIELVSKAAVSTNKFKVTSDGFFCGFDGGGQTFGVTAVVLEELPIGDEAVAILSDEKLIPIFDFCSAFSSDYDFGIRLVDAEDFLFVRNAAFADNSFVGVFPDLWQKGENVVYALKDNSGLAFA